MIKKVRMRFALAIVLFFSLSFTLKAQLGNLSVPYCMPLYAQSPCNQPAPSNTPGNFINDFIHSVITYSANLNINNPNSGCNAQNFPSIGFRNYIYHKCQHNLGVSAGQAISFSIQVGQFFSQGVAVYIDWNNDAVFSNPTEQVAASSSVIPAGGWGTYTITIPPSQPYGIYRMRVRCAAAVSGTTIDPCSSYSGGETEDYDVFVSNNSTVCAGNTLSLNLTYNTSSCTPSYTWAGPNAFSSNSQNPTIPNPQPVNSGNYAVTVSCGTACAVSLTTNITIDPSPTLMAVSNSSLICAGGQATLTASGATNYTWAPSGTGSVIVVSPTVTSTYTVSGTGTNVCVGTNTVMQNVSPCTSVVDQSSVEGIRVFPNPTKDELKFLIPNKAIVIIYNMDGKLMIKKEIKAGETMDISSLDKGIYFLYFTDNRNETPIKIIRN